MHSSTSLQFETGTAYGAAPYAQQLSVFLSTDFNGSNLGGVIPSSNPAHWLRIDSVFPGIQNGSSATAYHFTYASPTTGPVMLNPLLPSYTGLFYIGFRYTSNIDYPDSSQTFAINNFSLKY